MNDYLIPANTKKGQLIFNIFRWVDLIILLIGAIISIVLMIVFSGYDTVLFMALKLLPLGLCIALVIPIPYYHNILVFIQEAYMFIISRRTYRWKGWCATSVFNEQQK